MAGESFAGARRAASSGGRGLWVGLLAGGEGGANEEGAVFKVDVPQFKARNSPGAGR